MLSNTIFKIFIVSSAVTVSFSACTKLKDQSYSELVATQFEPKAGDVGALVGPAYGNWRDLYNNTGWYYTQEITADAVVIPARPNGWTDGGMYRRLHMHQWTTEDDYASDDWTKAYGGITNTNRILYQIESGQIPVDQGKENLIAELRALRASYYYTLCDIFGNVPIITKFDVPEGYLPKQNTRKEVYDFIVKELTEAIPLLSEKADKSTYGRFNKWAAYTLLAKMYLNAKVYAGQTEWDKCLAACEAVINSNKYVLEANHRDIFKTANENSKEIIFAIPFDEQYAGGFWMHLQTLHPSQQETYNISTFPWGGDCAIPQFIDTYDPDDNRLSADWLMGQQYSSSGKPLTGSMDQDGKPLVYVNDVPSIDSSTEFSGYREGKYEYKMGLQFNMSNDVPLFRYADLLMMKAECLLRTGKADEAAAIVTRIRERSFKDNPAKAVVSGADLMKGSVYNYGLRDAMYGWHSNEGGADIQYGRFLDELGWEFSQEGRRRQDLIRFGVFTTKSWFSHKPNGNHRILFTIPQDQLNKNPNLKQNPGY
jgi:starch-binding outer membrane protein, SusD/RagB family